MRISALVHRAEYRRNQVFTWVLLYKPGNSERSMIIKGQLIKEMIKESELSLLNYTS